eukprot:TRINITY_DN71926_c0_g1_i1.p1 TRINITY_DN71926_c0_g1~~TRINITY_DN71926_c0_g1_i1.p1  ORF type:complete len:740 (+),score=222.74 TRINITY_DN71926_c0_g1_i1:184-2403(+)
MSDSVGSKTELLNVLGDVKARVQDKLGIVDFPMPQFILIGKQSVGKSRLIEALAGEVFNFISGTLGSRRPTVLEFRHVASAENSRWFVRDMDTNQWQEHPVSNVMQIVGKAHEDLGSSVTAVPICVRIESKSCVDMQIVDLPGFRDFALDDAKKALAEEIHQLVMSFMADPRNVMLCVEQAGDAATMSTLAKCKEVDPTFKRTVLIRNKLDKYYKDLEPGNINQWVEGHGDMPEGLVRFALTLPFWQEGTSLEALGKDFVSLREEMNQKDVSTMSEKGIDRKFLKTIGFQSFAIFLEAKIQDMFTKSIAPVLTELSELKTKYAKTERSLADEYRETDPAQVGSTTQACGVSFAHAINDLMEGQLSVTTGQMTLEEELRAFHAYHKQVEGSEAFAMLPSEDFCGLDEYLEYLTVEAEVGVAHDHVDGSLIQIPVNGGAQWRRLMQEIEIFLRFSEIAVQTKKKDVIQARGVAMTSLTWRDVVVKLLSNEAHLPLQRRVAYVGERVKWFFMHQKEAILDFMVGLDDQPTQALYSANLPKHGKMIRQNEMIKKMVFGAFDGACNRQLKSFLDLFQNMLTSTFSNPWVFLKGATSSAAVEEDAEKAADTRARIPFEIQSRSGVETLLNRWLQDIPTDAHEIDEAVDKVQQLVLKTYSFIRSQVCDQVELFAESFFKVPMLRRLNEDMSNIELAPDDLVKYEARRSRLNEEKEQANEGLKEVEWCIERLQNFKLKMEAKGGLEF